MYLSISLTIIPLWLWSLHDLFLSGLLFELLQIGEKNKGWGCVEKEVGTKLIIQYIKNIVSQKKKIDVHMFFFPFLCPGIPDLVLGILKMLIRVCFRDYNNQ